MFPESFRKKIAAFTAWMFLFTNVSPAFGTNIPEYNIRIERQQVLNPVTGAMVSGFLVEAQRLVTQTIADAVQAYQTVFSQAVAPFMMATAAIVQSGASLYEILQRAKAEAQIFSTAPKAVGEAEESDGLDDALTSSSKAKEEASSSSSSDDSAPSDAVSKSVIETEISRGFCLSIPELGDLLISHDGDVVFDTKTTLGKSLKISAPAQVVLNNTKAKDIDVEATAAILTGKTKVDINSLRFRGIRGADKLANGLFIDRESELSVGSLSLEDALLLNTGRLTVARQMDLNGGYFFNTGVVATSADPSVLRNISYMFNGSTGSVTASGRMVLGADRFSNLGNIKAQSLSVMTADLLDNRGTIETASGLELAGLGTVVNAGRIDGKSGSVAVAGKKFEHAKGEILAAKVDFGSEETVLAGSVAGQEGFFRGKVVTTGNVHFQRGVIDGVFANSSDRTVFEQQLDLTGTRAEVQNKRKITTGEVVSNATIGIIDGGEISATSVQSKKHLQLGSNMPALIVVTTEAGAKLLIKKESATPKLRKIQNTGHTQILTAVPELADLQNAMTGYLQLESSAPLARITSLDHLQGKLDIKASMPAITALNLQTGTTLNLLRTADFSALKDIRVQMGATFMAEAESALPGLKNVHNFGTMTTKIQLMGLEAVYNAPAATIHFLERARIQGRAVSAADRALVPAMANLPGGKIGLFNEGKILTQIKLKPGETIDPKAAEYRGIDIKSGNYVASQDAVFRMEQGGVRAYDFFNDGIFYSPTRLKYWNFGSSVTRWGRGVAEDGIEYEIDSATSGTLSDTFKPIINGPNKKLLIKSKTGLNLSNPLNWNVDLEVETPIFNENANLTVRSFKAKTTTFNNTRTLSARDSIDIETENFTNISGRLQTHGDGKIKVDGLFRNTGGGRLEKDKPETLTNYIWDGSNLVPQTQTFYRDVYHPDLGKAGGITCGGALDIVAGHFDNSFGILNAAKKTEIKSLAEICNECGLIYSSGPTTLSGTLLKNGHMKGAVSVAGVDPNAPIRTQQSVPYQQWVQSGYSRESAGLISLKKVWVDTSHYETRYRIETVTTGYQPRTQSVSASQYPGYIFSDGDLDIQMNSDAYFGTIVSGGDVKIRGARQGSINAADRGLLVVRGNITAELKKAALEQSCIQARNICFQLIEDLLIRCIVKPVVTQNGSAVQITDLQRFARQTGFLMDEATFAEQESSARTPTGLVPLNLSSSSSSSSSYGGFSIHPTASSGFIGDIPRSRFFMSTVQDRILSQLITMTLAPLHGRDMLLSIDLAGQLRRSGARMAGAFRGTHTLTLPDGNPAILFDKSSNPDVEVEIEGETMMVPLYNPYLICDAVSRMLNVIQAEKLVSVQSLGDIRLEPGQIDIQSEDLVLDSQKQVQIAAEFKYSDSGNRVDVTPVELSVPGDLTISGKTGVSTQGAHLSAKTMRMTSSDGSIVDMDMSLDPIYTFLGGGRVLMNQQTVTSAFRTTDGMAFVAPVGTIDQHGTDMFAGPSGIVFDAQKHIWQPAFEESGYFHSHRKGFVSVHSKTPKVGIMHTPGSVIFRSKDTTLIGAQIIAGTVSNPIDGKFRTAPAYATQESYSYTTKSGFLGLGHSSVEIEETRETVAPTRIIADHFESLGVGTYDMESTLIRALDATITKNLIEKTAHDKARTRITQKSSGFFAPKIKGDPFVESLRGIHNVVTFSGDTLPTAFNIIGTGAQSLAHATTLANLSTNPNPISAVASVFLSRFMTGAVYNSTRTVVSVDESRPVQSRVDVGILRVDNSRTHLEGVWNVAGRGEIRTGELTTSAPEHTVTQTQETTGWSISLSPAALLGACLAPGLPTALGCLPNVSVQQSDGSSSSTTHAPAILRADDLFIRCDNAVFSGSKIHARLTEAIVDGNLTIETLTNEFRSDSHSTAIGGSLTAVSGMLMDVKVDPLYAPQTASIPGSSGFIHPAFSAVPTMRIASEEDMSRKIREVAEMVGTERFYLTIGGLLHKKGALVGLKPDGVVVRDDAERIQAGRVLEEKVREAESHKRSVINPSIAEFTAMMAQVDELQQVRARIRLEQMAANAPREEIERTDREVKEFLEKPEVKEALVKQKTAQKKLAQVMKEISHLAAEDPTLPMKMAGMQTKKDAPTAPATTSSAKPTPKASAAPKDPIPTSSSSSSSSSGSSSSSSSLSAMSSAPEVSSSADTDILRLFEYTRAKSEKNTLMKSVLDAGVSVKKSMDAYASSHSWSDKLKHGAMAVVQGVGYGLTAGAIAGAACEGGWLAALATGGSIFATGEAFAAVVESGGEGFVDYAISQADTQEQARDYADVAMSWVEAGATGIAAFGAFKAVRGISAKASALRTSYSKSKIDSTFQLKYTNPLELETRINQSIIGSIENIPSVMADRYSLATREYSKFLHEPRGKGRADWAEVDLKKRGLSYEAKICSEEFANYTRTPVNAEAFDAFDFSRGHGVSIKSLDTQTPARLANPKSITGTLDKYINDIVNFKKIDKPSVPFLVKPEHVLSAEIFVGVPKSTTLEQFMAIQRSAQRAKLNEIQFTLKVEE